MFGGICGLNGRDSHPTVRRACYAAGVLKLGAGFVACVCLAQSAGSSGAEAQIRELMDRQGIPGAVAAVAVPGRPLWVHSFGMADLENQVPVRDDAVFRIGSLSKLITTAAAVRLVEKGKLDLDAEIHRYVPAFPAKAYPITARELAGHLAGIRHYGRDEYVNTESQSSVTENLKRFAGSPLLFVPGSKYLYSSYGFVLLSAVVEGAAGEDFLAVVRDEITGPLGMTATVADRNGDLIAHRVRPYSKDSSGRIVNGPYMDTSDRLGAGGFVSTAADLVRFGRAMLEGSYLQPQTRAMVFTTQKTADGKETGVGLGWRIGKDSQGRTIYHHGGDTIGGHAFLLLYPEEGIVSVFLSNLSFARFGEKDAEALVEHFRADQAGMVK